MNASHPDEQPARWDNLPARAPTPASPVARPSPAMPASLAAGPDAKALLHALERRWPLALLGGLGLGALAATAAFLLIPPPKYTVKAMLQVASTPNRILFETREMAPDYRSYQRTQAVLAKSRKVLIAALRDPAVSQVRSIPAEDDPATWLDRELKVDFPGNAEIMTFTMTAAEPRDAVVLVNAACDAYIKQIVQQERQQRVARYDGLREIFNKYQDKLREKRKGFRAAVEDVGPTDKLSVAARQQSATQNLGRLQAELVELRAEIRRVQLKAKVAAANRDRPGVPPAPAQGADPSDGDPQVAELQQKSVALREELARASRRSRDPGDPSVEAARQRYEANQRALRARIDQARTLAARDRARDARDRGELEQADFDRQLDVLQEQEATLREEVALLGSDLKTGNVKVVELNGLDDEVALISKSALAIGSELEALDVELKAGPRIHPIERAESPVLADGSRRYKISGGVGVAGFALFAGLVVFLEARARRVGSADEVVEDLGIRLIGSIPARPRRPQLGKAGEAWQRVLIESVDAARTLILNASRREPLKVIMVASAVKGEGKTTLACLLAASLQRAGRRTLLIDGDLRCPAIHRLMDITPEAGLCEVLRGEAPLEGVVIPAAGPGVDFLPAGRLDGEALRGLTDGRLAGLLDDVRDLYDQVIIDSAPTFYVPDGLIIAQHVDSVVLAVLRGVSQAPKVHRAHSRLVDLGVKVLGAVVGGIRGDGPGGYSYQYARGGLEDRHEVA